MKNHLSSVPLTLRLSWEGARGRGGVCVLGRAEKREFWEELRAKGGPRSQEQSDKALRRQPGSIPPATSPVS